MRFFFTKRHDAETHLELLLVSAVTTILVVRFLLAATSYPQIASGGLHIAHMLWGGLLMLGAIVFLLSFVDTTIIPVVSMAGGVGLGLFIDELGKFITRDNDYFFEPTIALIYIFFILFYLVIRFIQTRRVSSKPKASGSFFQKYYTRLLEKGLVTKGLIAVFVVYTLINLYNTIDIISLFFRLSEFSLSFIDWGELISVLISTIVVIIGIVLLKFSRLRAYTFFQYAILISIFFTQFFNFYKVQLSAFWALVFNVVMFFVVKFLIQKEQQIKEGI